MQPPPPALSGSSSIFSGSQGEQGPPGVAPEVVPQGEAAAVATVAVTDEVTTSMAVCAALIAGAATFLAVHRDRPPEWPLSLG